MAANLPPMPNNPITDTFVWRDWFFKVSQLLVQQASIAWTSLDFTGSNLLNIQTRQHNALQTMDGGGTYHLSAGQYAKLAGFYNYGQWYSTADQTFTATTATKINLDTTVANVGMSLASNTITIANAGTYNITYSIQLANTDTGTTRYATFWFRKNGTDVVGSASKFNVPSHHGSLDGYTVAVSNLVVTCAVGDTIELYGGMEVIDVYIEAYVAQTTPYNMPSIPGAILTIQQVT